MTYKELVKQINFRAGIDPEVWNQDVTILENDRNEFYAVGSLQVENDHRDTSGVLDAGHIYLSV